MSHRYSQVMTANILSPYGKNVTAELSDVYNLASVDELLERVSNFLANSYGFAEVHIEEIHVAFGIAVRFSHAGTSYYLKFTGRANHGDPEGLFRYLTYLREQQLPLPKILKTVDGTHFETILDHSPYDVTYVMKTLPGRPMIRKTAGELEQYAHVMAQFHRLGAAYEPKVYARSRDVHRYFAEARDDLESASLSSEQQKLLSRILAYTDERLAPLKSNNTLSKTHVHRDFRLCHVLFEGQNVSGIIDAEHAEYAERIFDLCMGLVSHPNPARCLLLDLGEILNYVKHYDGLYPPTQPDRQTLKAMLLFALLNELSGALLFVDTGQSEARETDIAKLWLILKQVEMLPGDLGLFNSRHPTA